mmetsp:Transcript_9845/g.21009  ORF Transcript_9845/g.21009 Transcript_9845/m.21009 type:complete len:470 (-) Transcript_9845:2382-3791(-)
MWGATAFQPSSYTAIEALVDPYAGDIARKLSVSGASSEGEVISKLRSLDLGDDFWMYSFKVVPCAKSYSHKWTLCPCAHAGETARRRDPRLHNYKAVLCPLVKAKKTCPLGDNCMWAHNVFEHWLHPSRYKTRLCSFGRNCNRPICFFAHSAEELRCVPNVDDGKELDEREYLLQLMLAQEAGMLPVASQQQQQPVVLQQTAVQLGDGNVVMVPTSSTAASGMQQLLLNPVQATAARPKAPARTTVAVTAPVHPNQGGPSHRDTATQLLLGLQEQLAGVTLAVDGLSAVSGAPHAGRISDPGQAHHLLPGSAVNPIPHLNRISDSGQTMGLAGASRRDIADLESLLPLVNTALAGGAISLPTTTSGSPLSRGSPAPPSNSNSGPLNLSHTSSPENSINLSQLQQATNPQVGSPLNAAAAATASRVANSANMSQLNLLVAQLQEQGLANTKEQLVASLSQLLAQLLSVNS